MPTMPITAVQIFLSVVNSEARQEELFPFPEAFIGVTHPFPLQLLEDTIASCAFGHGLLKDPQRIPANKELHHALTVESCVVARGSIVGVAAILEAAEQVPGLLVALAFMDPVVLGDVLRKVAGIARLLVYKSARNLSHRKGFEHVVQEAEWELEGLQGRLDQRRVHLLQQAHTTSRHKLWGMDTECRHCGMCNNPLNHYVRFNFFTVDRLPTI